MTGRHGRGARGSRGGQDNPASTAEAEAIATATVIAGLRWRLQHQETLEHPRVLSELRKLEQQVAEHLEIADGNPGRHRSTADKAIRAQLSDVPGFELKPDPRTATTPAEFIGVLRQYRAWSGDPSWRKMAELAGQAVVHSTMFTAMHGDSLPKLEVVKAVVVGCGGGEDDLSLFAIAWRRLASGRTQNLPAGEGERDHCTSTTTEPTAIAPW